MENGSFIKLISNNSVIKFEITTERKSYFILSSSNMWHELYFFALLAKKLQFTSSFAEILDYYYIKIKNVH